MEQYAMYLRKSRFDRDYAECSVEETLKRHETLLVKMADERGYHIAKTFYEVVSGESIAARPEVQTLLEEVNAGLYAGVLVVDVERLARGNGADQAYISQVFQFSGTKIITPAKTYDPSNEFDEEYFEFGLFMSRREYKTINRRLVRGRDSSASEGKYISSIAPYGYKRLKLPAEKGYTLEPHPDEADVVRRIFSMFLQQNGTKMIANTLNDMHIPTRHGDLWTYSTISQILSNPVYMGKIRRGWSKQIKSVENGKVKKRMKRHKNMDDYKLYDGLHPALIDEDTFWQVQQVRMQRQPSAPVKKTTELQNAFAGVIFCGICGKRIGRTTMSVTQSNRVRLRCINSRNCHNVSADYDVVEKAIIDALHTWLQGYRIKIDTVGFADDISNCRVQLNQLAQESDKLNAQLNNAYDLVEQGIYTLDVFRTRREKLTNQLDELQQRQLALNAMLEKLENSDTAQSNLIPQTEELLASYADMTNQERNAMLKIILKRIEYTKGEDGRIIIDLYPKLPKM